METLIQEPKIWVAAAFFLFMLGFIRFALPMLVRALDNRAGAIATELSEATRLRAEAQALLDQYRQHQADVMKESADMLEHARLETETMKKDASKQLEIMIERRTKLAHERIARAEADAMTAMKRQLSTVALAAATHLVSQTSVESGAPLTEETLSALDRLVH